MFDQSKKVLLIEDEKNIIETMSKAFSAEGFTVLSAEDGERGLETALAEHPDIVLLDIMMPQMDGLTLMKKLRDDEWGKTARIIILSNLDASDVILQEVVKYQPSLYITKSEMEVTEVVVKAKEILGFA